MTSQFWIGGGHCWESWGIPRPGVHVLFWWPCPHGRRLTTGQSRGGDRPLLSSQSTSAGQLQPLWHGPGGSVLSTPLPSSEWKKVNCGKYRTCSFVCVFSLRPRGTGAQSARQSIDLTFRRWLAGGRHPATLHNPPCTATDVSKTMSSAIVVEADFRKTAPLPSARVELFVCKNIQAAFAADTWANYNAFPFHGLHFQNIKSRSWQRCQFESFLRLSHLDQ